MEIDPKEDGVTHINVYSQGKTEIGRFYSNFAKSPIVLPEGIFMSVEAYWYYLTTGGKSPKNTYGFNAKQEGKKWPKIHDIDEDKIRYALDVKLRSYIPLIVKLDNFDLPLTHYYKFKDFVKWAGYEWVIEHLELRRSQIRDWLKQKKPGS